MAGRLIYSGITSLDGYLTDENGTFDWAEPDEQVHAFVNDRERAIGTSLYGRRMYDVLKVWEDMQDTNPVMRDFAEIWRAADKVVYSRSLEEPSTPRTRIEREFDPVAVRTLKESAETDIAIGGPELAVEALSGADAAWLVSSTRRAVPVRSVDGAPLRVDRELTDAFEQGLLEG